jgi:hypothetical protein
MDDVTDAGPPPSPGPITAPPAPRTLYAPHNLYTADEMVQSLHLLRGGVEGGNQRVQVTWLNAGERWHHLVEVAQIVDVEDVQRISLDWSYPDGSSVRGTVVNRPDPATLRVNGGGLAWAAARLAIDHLRGQRPGRARVRGYLAGRGLPSTLGMAVILTGVALWVISGSASVNPTTIGIVLMVLGGAVTLSPLAYGRIQRWLGGTRLARAPEVERKSWLTQEIGVLAGVVGAAATVAFGLLAMALK